MEITNFTTVLSSIAVGVVAAILFKGRSGWFATEPLAMGLRNMKMVLIVRSDLELGRNSVAAQCSQAAIGCYKKAQTNAPLELRKWEREGQTKVVLKTPGESDLLALKKSAEDAGLVAVLVRDNAAASRTPMVLGIGPGTAKLVDKVAGHLKLF